MNQTQMIEALIKKYGSITIKTSGDLIPVGAKERLSDHLDVTVEVRTKVDIEGHVCDGTLVAQGATIKQALEKMIISAGLSGWGWEFE